MVKSDAQAYYKLTKDLWDASGKKTSILPPVEEFIKKVEEMKGKSEDEMGKQLDAIHAEAIAQGATEEEAQMLVESMKRSSSNGKATAGGAARGSAVPTDGMVGGGL